MNQINNIEQQLNALRAEQNVSHQQAKKYAEDLIALFQSEKESKDQLVLANAQLKKFAEDLNNTISDLKAANQQLSESYLETINKLALAAEYKDEDTGEHIVRMGQFSAFLAEKAGLGEKEVENILYAAPMHDVGKIGIPDSILLKPGKLNDEEWVIMRSHAVIGTKLLAGSKSEIIQMAEEIAMTHHEKWDGKGYPNGLKGEEIPITGRIVAIADVFDALTSRRPYKEPFSIERSIEIIEDGRGKHFDPALVAIFLENLDAIIEIKNSYANTN